jgi:hypothetical protein
MRAAGGGDALQLCRERCRGLRGEFDTLVSGVIGERDAAVGGPARVVTVVGVTAFHLEHVRQRRLELSGGRFRTGTGLCTRPSQAEQPRPVERLQRHRVPLVAAKQK